ncbi:hypothetical protein [Rugamonas aquatica]|uniref:Uncharacterized protein n=1 Tax=Rugamonas aquatica TaxID=2743357 RepID=A0A6A7MWN5_9BURK|nr:hypothetical protein [Rugamonas aquatica]MQA37150.1 hypothetical protein [Rugamonas aquatica]
MTAKRLLLLLSVVVAAMGVWRGVDLLTRPPEQLVPAFSAQPDKRMAAAAAAAGHVPAAAPLPAGTSIEDQVRDAAGDPEKSFAAFQKIQQCLTLESDKEIVDNQEVKVTKEADGMQIQLLQHKADEPTLRLLRQSCAGLTGRTRMDRFQLLSYAVDHYVDGSLSVYILAGPNGDREALANGQNDPAVAEWRSDALKRLEERVALGYADALLFSPLGHHELGKTQTSAELYAEHLAVNKVIGPINGNDTIYPQALLDGWAKDLNGQQKSDADAQANRIFLAWKQRQPISR